jgi:hypothetical protein
MNRRKQFRAVATRFGRLAVRYQAMVCVADIFIWLRARPDRSRGDPRNTPKPHNCSPYGPAWPARTPFLTLASRLSATCKTNCRKVVLVSAGTSHGRVRPPAAAKCASRSQFAQQTRSNSAPQTRTYHLAPALLLWCNALLREGLWWAGWWGSLDGMQGVRGSNPLSSTRHNASPALALSAICQRFARKRCP